MCFTKSKPHVDSPRDCVFQMPDGAPQTCAAELICSDSRDHFSFRGGAGLYAYVCVFGGGTRRPDVWLVMGVMFMCVCLMIC